MKFKELAQLGSEEQEKKLKELELELIKLNAQVATGTPPKNAGQLRRLKKDIARIMLLKGIKGRKEQKLVEKQAVEKQLLTKGNKIGKIPYLKTAKKTSEKTK
jgi:ribosomal protein L29